MLSQKVMNGEVSSLIIRKDVNETDPFSDAQHSRATLQSLAMMSILSKRITKLLLEMKLIKDFLFNYSLGNNTQYDEMQFEEQIDHLRMEDNIPMIIDRLTISSIGRASVVRCRCSAIRSHYRTNDRERNCSVQEENRQGQGSMERRRSSSQ